MDVHFIIYNLPRDVSGLEQRVRLVDDRGKILMDSPLPLAAVNNLQPQALQGTRVKLQMPRGRYAIIVGLQGAKGKIDVERRADFVVE